MSIIKHIALTGSSNKNLLFTDKSIFLIIWTTCHISFYSRPIESCRLQFYPELLLRSQLMVSLVLGDLFLFIFS